MRAERRLGELIAAQKETVGLNAGARGIGKSGVPPKHPTLSDAGIDKKLSSRAQKLAAVPEEQFEGMLGEWRAPNRLHIFGEKTNTNVARQLRQYDVLDTTLPASA